jgi:hypothetical protein
MRQRDQSRSIERRPAIIVGVTRTAIAFSLFVSVATTALAVS